MARTLNQLEAVAAWEEARATYRAICDHWTIDKDRTSRLLIKACARINRRMVLASKAINPNYRPDPRWDSKGYYIA